MSSLTYYKMLVIGKQVKQKIQKARAVCKSRPHTKECNVAWRDVLQECDKYECCEVIDETEFTLKDL